jgi:hypothetical protein
MQQCMSVGSLYFSSDYSLHGDFNVVMPNVFFPEGVNAKFAPVVPFPFEQTQHNSFKANLKIYTRWGQKIYDETVDYLPFDPPFDINASLSWDGTYNGQPSPMDTYAYVLYLFNCDNYEEIRGDVTLIR